MQMSDNLSSPPQRGQRQSHPFHVPVPLLSDHHSNSLALRFILLSVWLRPLQKGDTLCCTQKGNEQRGKGSVCSRQSIKLSCLAGPLEFSTLCSPFEEEPFCPTPQGRKRRNEEYWTPLPGSVASTTALNILLSYAEANLSKLWFGAYS